jgi:hypothetical protein
MTIASPNPKNKLFFTIMSILRLSSSKNKRPNSRRHCKKFLRSMNKKESMEGSFPISKVSRYCSLWEYY